MYRVFIICFFSKILKYIPDSGRSRFSSVVYTDVIMAGRTPTLQQNWQSSEKSQHFKEKTQYLMNTLYLNEVDDVEEALHELCVRWTQPSHRQVHLPLKLAHRAESSGFRMRRIYITYLFPYSLTS